MAAGIVTRHAEALADALGGRVFSNTGGAVVVVESEFNIAMSQERLGSLPYSIDASAPIVCIDLETTGLATAAGTLAFLVGVGLWRDGLLRVHQLVLPDHAGEQALLDLLRSLLPPDAWLVTYNGKSFDWPLLTARYRLHRRDPPPYSGHLDLLHVARQLWKHRIGGARLALVESAVCGVVRDDDLPGHLIPERYFTYLRSREPRLLVPVLEHNRQDVVSLVQLLAVLARDVADETAWSRSHPGDLFGLARAHARHRRPEDALRVVESALGADAWSSGLEGGAQLHRRLAAERARLLAFLGRRDEAYEAWLEICVRGGPGAGLAWLHVARYREHARRDVPGALDACREAGSIAERARAWGAPLLSVEADLARRLPRLKRLAFRRRPFSRGVGRAA
ncbi:MAG: ribonuclease H-like domain-containing protein [Candidatus Limnocylindrales bacterium]